MWKSYARFWRLYFNFHRESSRADFMWVVLINAVIYAVLAIPAVVMQPNNLQAIQDTGTHPASQTPMLAFLGILILATTAYFIATIIPWIALECRRLRDVGLNIGVALNLVIIVSFLLGLAAGGVIGGLLIIISFLVWLVVILLCVLPQGYWRRHERKEAEQHEESEK
ncbi:DUF805 domain-containing protein [Lactobacillaceae bacterium L1_55_11]|nr:DUF805 domain-containing protein [Lactobacillaceae bacterium L1_55_11]